MSSDDPIEDALRQDAAHWRATGGSGTPEQHERLLNNALRFARIRRIAPVTLSAAAVAAVIVATLIGVLVQTSSSGIGPAPAASSGAQPTPGLTCTALANQNEQGALSTPSACGSSLSAQHRASTRAPIRAASAPTTPPTHVHSHHPAAPPATKPHHTSTPPSTTNQASPPPTQASSTPSSGPDATCMTSDLELDTGQAAATGGSGDQSYYLKNVGPSACSMYGYPDVSQLTDSGQAAGPPAAQDPNLNEDQETGQQYPEQPVVLQSGQQAEFTVSTSCQTSTPATITQLQVYPPNNTEPIERPDSVTEYCSQSVGYVIPL